ncbi:MAG: hypothetical protein Q4F56_00230 [Candidatus Saccharibacteria bacterium]|nr:hypothetical protein [Candidatus Saccharibacteria bacterium]
MNILFVIAIFGVIFGLVTVLYHAYLINPFNPPIKNAAMQGAILIGFVVLGLSSSYLFSILAENSEVPGEQAFLSGLASFSIFAVFIAMIAYIAIAIIRAFMKKNEPNDPKKE